MLEELFCAHRAELTAYCRGLCRSDAAAQDMVQEVFLRAWQNIGTLQDLGPSQRRAWLYRTARNLFVDAMRRTAREAAALPELEPEPETPDPDFAEAEARRAYLSAHGAASASGEVDLPVIASSGMPFSSSRGTMRSSSFALPE